MKKFALSAIAIIAIVSLVFAGGPVEKGSNIVAGGIAFGSYGGDLYEDANEDGMSMFNIDVTYARFFLDMPLAIGLRFGFNSFSQGDNKNSEMTVGPGVAYYFKLTNEQMLPYVLVAFGFTTASWETANADDSGSGTTIAIEGGLDYLLGDHLAVSPSIFYWMPSMEMDSWGESYSGSVFGVKVGLTGFIY